jgi:hypothetical protein
MSRTVRFNNIPAIKAAFESNQGLEILSIKRGIIFETLDDFKLLFQGIAAAPKLQQLCLVLRSASAANEAMKGNEICRMLANALKDCQNTSLESVSINWRGYEFRDDKIWNSEVIPIVEFNRVRRLFQENKKVKLIRSDLGAPWI